MSETLGLRPGETSANGEMTLETSPDVAAGATSPAIRVDTLVYGPVDEDKATHIVSERVRSTAAAAGS